MAKIKVTDLIVKWLEEHGVRHVFMISGGGAMHLNDSIGRSKKIRYTCNHHEQACAIGAEGYARASGKMGVVCVTSGPGGTNTLTGVIGQWLDSVPVLYLSGQVKFETTITSCPGLGLRQLGDQEINIVDIVRPVTKYAVMVTDPKEIMYHLERAAHLAAHGRPGPVWLDIPLNVQGALVEESDLTVYEGKYNLPGLETGEVLKTKVSQVIGLLKAAKRPLLLAGHGIRIAGAGKAFLALAERTGLPVVTTFNGFDLIPSDHPLFVGRVGTIGTRAGNFALQSSDLLLSIGSRNNIRQVSYDWKNYAKKAKTVVVDIDPAELGKPTMGPDVPVNADAGEFLEELGRQVDGSHLSFDVKDWTDWCIERRERYPVVLPEQVSRKGKVDAYHFVKTLTECMDKGATLVAGNGTACVVTFQAGVVKKGSRMFWNSGCASMGYDLPAAIGACFANGEKDVVCLAGDGSLMMNIQELETVAFYGLPIKLFVLNNEGYVSIRQTQNNFFQGRLTACDDTCGVGFPDFRKVAASFGLRTERLSSNKDLERKVKAVLARKGPVVCEVELSRDYIFAPKLSSEKRPDGTMVSKPLEDMYPFLPREEFIRNIINDDKEDGR